MSASVASPRRPTSRLYRVKAFWPWLVILPFLLFSLFPVYWIVLTAFRPRDDIFQSPVAILPHNLTLDNIRYVWFGSASNAPVVNFLGTSLTICVLATLAALIFGVACAYAVGRFRIGGSFLPLLILSFRYVPPIALIVPLFMMYRQLGLLDSYTGLILIYALFSIPLIFWLLLGYVEASPAELEEAAYVDGAGHWKALRYVVLPVLMPGIAVAAVFTFIGIWNEFVLAYQLAGNKVTTITVYLPRLRTAIAELYGEIAAASLLAVLPGILFAAVMQRFLVRGLAFGGLK
jgi:multiple sugar transport system permease protein